MPKPKFTLCNDAAAASSGAKVLFATDDFFASADNLLKDGEPIWNDEFTEFGKWMDGWETRRRRAAGHDWCIIKLAGITVIKGIQIDTAFFTGNYPPHISIQGIKLPPGADSVLASREPFQIGVEASATELEKCNLIRSDEWPILVPMTLLHTKLQDLRHKYFSFETNEQAYTHIRFNLHPDGGIARLRIYGEIHLIPGPTNQGVVLDMLSMQCGGKCLSFSNAHYGHPKNLIKPGRGINMGDGWETARRLDRPPSYQILSKSGLVHLVGTEWAIFKLGAYTDIVSIEVDTNHFKGNAPDHIRIFGTTEPAETLVGMVDEPKWEQILTRQKLSPHTLHIFKKEILPTGPFNCVKIEIVPDGGISRIRIYGKIHTVESTPSDVSEPTKSEFLE